MGRGEDEREGGGINNVVVHLGSGEGKLWDIPRGGQSGSCKSVGKSAPRGNCISRANPVGMKRSLSGIEENASPALRAAGAGVELEPNRSRTGVKPTSTI